MLKKEEITIYSPAKGKLIALEEVNDVMFSNKMMGPGFAIVPKDGNVGSPVEGSIINTFNTKHAVGFKSKSLEVLLHMGINTFSLQGIPFNSLIKEIQSVKPNEVLTEIDLNYLKEHGRDTAIIVVFTNESEVIDYFEIYNLGEVERGQEIGKVYLK